MVRILTALIGLILLACAFACVLLFADWVLCLPRSLRAWRRQAYKPPYLPPLMRRRR